MELAQAQGQTYVGTVKSFNPAKGWGFIECAETHQMYGADIFLLKGELNGFGVSKGDSLSFTVKQGPKGVQATNVQVLNPSDPGQSFFGEIKSFNPLKGYGFISSAASEKLYGKDIFVMKSEVGPMATAGTQVQFKVKPGDRGPVAVEVHVLGALQQGGFQQGGFQQGGFQQGGWGGGGGGATVGGGSWGGKWGGGPQWPAVAGQGGPGGKGAGTWGGFGGWGPAGGAGWNGAPAMGPRPPSETEVFFGTIKSINEEKGWGHIASDAMNRVFGKDIFVMKSGFEGKAVQVGQQVTFTVATGPKGPHAVNIQPFTESPDRVYSGTVRSFNELKGWGFIDSPDAKQLFHTDIFLHKKELHDVTVNTGDQVQFTVDVAGGRAAAKTVQVGSFGAVRAVPQAFAARAAPY